MVVFSHQEDKFPHLLQYLLSCSSEAGIFLPLLPQFKICPDLMRSISPCSSSVFQFFYERIYIQSHFTINITSILLIFPSSPPTSLSFIELWGQLDCIMFTFFGRELHPFLRLQRHRQAREIHEGQAGERTRERSPPAPGNGCLL